ncbi:DUF6491 family protein [Lysobacter koreensis]|uniref:DUF6491 family protein n=1 Tax=Lysobacter koreensis TaxID=266122 RepID=A0ABW2YMA7_9GAMM
MKTLLCALLATLSLGACASDRGLRDAERLSLYRAHAGEPVASFRYTGSLNGWTPLGDSALAVWTRPRQAYLLSLNGTCTNLDFAQAITITNQFHTVYAKFDKVIVLDRSSINIPCHIREIRPLDVAALKDAEREIRADARVSEREG